MKIHAKRIIETRKAIPGRVVEMRIEKGIKASRMRAAARKAKVGDTTIYNDFPGKESLIYGCCKDAIETINR